jgi:hypothetical protein
VAGFGLKFFVHIFIPAAIGGSVFMSGRSKELAMQKIGRFVYTNGFDSYFPMSWLRVEDGEI